MATTFSNAFNGPEALLIGAALIVFFIARQFSARRVISVGNVIAPAALLYFGLQGIGRLDSAGWLLLGLNMSLAVGLGAARGLTFRVWTNPLGQTMMRGTPLTIALWIATIAVKIGLTFAEARFGLSDPGGTTVQSLLGGAVTIGAQLVVVYLRAQDQRATSYRVS